MGAAAAIVQVMWRNRLINATRCNRSLSLLASCLLGSLLLSLLGCAEAGTLWYEAFGNPDVKAAYKPPKVPTLIVVENGKAPSTDTLDDDTLAAQIGDDLKAHKVVPLVDGSKVQQLRDSDPSRYRSMSIADLARMAGAKQVLYVDLQSTGVAPDPSRGAATASASARVRIVDVGSGNNAWPIDNAAGYPVSVDVPYNSVDESHVSDMHAQLMDKLSESIGRLFHSYQPDDGYGGDDDKPHVMQDM